MEILGFTGTTTLTPNFTTPKAMYTGQEPYLALHANMPPQNIEWFQGGNPPYMDYSDLLANIPINVPPYAPIIYECRNDNWTWQLPARGQRLGTVEFYVTNRYGTPVVMTDDFDFTLKIELLEDDEKDLKGLAARALDLQKIHILSL